MCVVPLPSNRTLTPSRCHHKRLDAGRKLGVVDAIKFVWIHVASALINSPLARYLFDRQRFPRAKSIGGIAKFSAVNRFLLLARAISSTACSTL